LVEAANCPPLRGQLTVTGRRVNAWFTNWVRIAGSADPGRDAPIIMNHWTGIVLHQLANPDPILLLSAGRLAALPQLAGDGAAELTARLRRRSSARRTG